MRYTKTESGWNATAQTPNAQPIAVTDATQLAALTSAFGKLPAAPVGSTIVSVTAPNGSIVNATFTGLLILRYKDANGLIYSVSVPL